MRGVMRVRFRITDDCSGGQTNRDPAPETSPPLDVDYGEGGLMVHPDVLGGPCGYDPSHEEETPQEQDDRTGRPAEGSEADQEETERG